MSDGITIQQTMLAAPVEAEDVMRHESFAAILTSDETAVSYVESTSQGAGILQSLVVENVDGSGRVVVTSKAGDGSGPVFAWRPTP